jgi:hypothetical protein
LLNFKGAAMTAGVRARPSVATHRTGTPRPPQFEPTNAPEPAEELRLRLDDVPIPAVTLAVEGLRPTLGSWIFGHYYRSRSSAKPRAR